MGVTCNKSTAHGVDHRTEEEDFTFSWRSGTETKLIMGSGTE